MTGPLPLARKFGEMLDCYDEIPIAEPIETQVARLTRSDIWPQEVWAEMQRIQSGEADGELVDRLAAQS